MNRSSRNPLRGALARGKLMLGSFQVLSDPAATEIVLGTGFDFVLIDAEHRPFQPETVEQLVRAAQGQGAQKTAVVRIPMLSRGAIQYALETGADGILAPLVNTREEAEAVVEFSRYPPEGSRGLNMSTRAA